MWKFKCIRHVSAADGLDFFRTQLVPGGGRAKPVPQQAHRPLANGKENVFLILETNVAQGAPQASTTGNLIDRDQVPALLGVESLRGVEDFSAPALLFFHSTLGDVRHGPNDRQELTRCQL